MNLEKFLSDNPIINKAELARQMWPGHKSANIKLGNKIAGSASDTGRQRVTEKDEELAKKSLISLVKKILDYVNQ